MTLASPVATARHVLTSHQVTSTRWNTWQTSGGRDQNRDFSSDSDRNGCPSLGIRLSLD